MYISVLPLRKVVMVMMDMVKYCHICCRWDKCIYFVRKTKFQVKFFNIFSKSALDTLGAIFVCPVRPVSGSVRPVHGVCRNCTSGVRVFAMPVFVPCCRSSSPCPFFAIFVCRQTVSVGQFGASVLPVAPAAVIPVGWLRPLRGRGGRREESPGLIHPLRRIPCRAVRRPNRRAGCAPWGSGR